MTQTKTSSLAVALLLAARLAAAQADGPADQLASGKLQADLGNWKAAAAAFQSVAADAQAPAALQWEALVRLGVARQALGDARGSVAAFQKVMADHSGDAEAVRFLALSVGGSLPGSDRWDKVWRDVRLVVDGQGTDKPRARIAWPGAPATRSRGGERMSLDLQDAPLGDVYRLFADFTGLNVVVQPGVSGRITLHVKDEPWQDVLERVLAPNGYWYSLEGPLLWIAQAPYVALFGPRAWSGKPIDIDYNDEDLREALRQIARNGGSEPQFDASVAGHVTFRLVKVPWDQAFEIVLRTNGLLQRRAGATLVVEPRPKS
jgi:hypothetical protein